MNTITDRDDEAPAHICKLMKIVGGFGLLSVIFVICYGMCLVQTAPREQENVVLLAPEQTVLFYQPEVELELAPLADVPQELEYINRARYLA